MRRVMVSVMTGLVSSLAMAGDVLGQAYVGSLRGDGRARDGAFVMGSRVIIVRPASATRSPDRAAERTSVAADARTNASAAVDHDRTTNRKDDKNAAATHLVVETRGSELLVVRVTVPTRMRWDGTDANRRAQYRVVVSRFVQVVGPSSGFLDLARDSALVLALRVSRRAPAGRSLAGTVEFTLGAATAQVAVDAEVPVMRRLAMSVPPQGIAASRGRWSQLAIRVSNDGNVPENPAIRVDAPSDWRVELRPIERVEPQARALASGTSRTLALRLWVPSSANQGVVMVPVQLARPDSAPLVVQVPVDVLSDITGTAAGPTLTTSVVAGRSGAAEALQGYAVTLGGPVSDSLRIAGRFSYAGANSALGGAGFALARAGVLTTPPSFEIEHPRAQLSAGATAGAFPELGGQFLAGLGGIARVRRGALQARAFDLRPMSQQQQFSLVGHAPGRFRGGELGVDLPRARAAIFGASLEDPTTRRALDVWGIRGGFGSALGSGISSELAYRTHAGGTGLGVATSARLIGQRSSLDIRAMHAPGGSQAFARASDELLATATHMLGRRSYIAIGGWTQRDDNQTMGAAQNRGWYVTPNIAFWRSGSLGFEARGQAFSAGTAQGRIGTKELAGGGTLNVTVAGTQLTGRSLLAQLDRSLGGLDLSSLSSRQWRLDHMVLASRGGMRGALSVAYMQQQYSGSTGSLPGQQSLTVRLDRFRPFLTRSLLVDAEWQRMQVGRTLPAAAIARASLSVPLVAGMRVALGVERNPFMSLSTSSGRAPLLYSLRLDRATTLPRLSSSANGLVFRDENANGRRDRGERGVAGVVVLCGGSRVATDTHGRYACSQTRHDVDARTVPTGLVAARPRVAAGEAIALRVVQPLHITLRVPASDSARLSRAALSQVVVSARDSSGYAWRARALGDGHYVVDALPIGRYELVMDASAAEEPLALAGSAPTIEIGATANTPDVSLDVRPRPLRMRTFNSDAPGAIPVESATDAPTPTRSAAPARAAAPRTKTTGSRPAARSTERPQ